MYILALLLIGVFANEQEIHANTDYQDQADYQDYQAQADHDDFDDDDDDGNDDHQSLFDDWLEDHNPANVLMSGYNLAGTRYFTSNLKAKDVPNLKIKWNVTLCGSPIASPLIASNRVCVTDYGGCLTCVNDATGAIIYRKNLTSDYGFPAGQFSRSTPTKKGQYVVMGTTKLPGSPGVGAWIFAVFFRTGNLIWKTKITNDRWAVVTSSPQIKSGFVYAATSSIESGAVLSNASYNCCETGSSLYELRLSTGRIVKEYPIIPKDLVGPGKYSGAMVWGQFVIQGRHLYLGTGQLYATPQSVADCSNNNPNNASCVDPRVPLDSVLKFRLSQGLPNVGGLVARFSSLAADTWNVGCLLGLRQCQNLGGAAYDFDMTNIMISKKTKSIFSISKMGVLYRLDMNLNKIWSRQLINGSISGGYVYSGVLIDHKNPSKIRVFLPNNNGERFNYTLPNGTVTNAGAHVCYDGNGNQIWLDSVPGGGALGDTAYGSLAGANDLILGSTRYQGLLLFRNTNGQLLRTIQTAGSMSAAPAFGRDAIFWPLGPGQTSLSIGRPLINQASLIALGL